MGTSTKVLLGVFISFFMVIILTIMFVLSAKFTAEEHENGIEAIYSDMQNVYANAVVQTLKTKAQVVGQYKGDLLEVVKANMERYKNDQNLIFKSIAEQAGLTIDASVYKELQTSIGIAYSKFESSQRDKIDRVRVYKNFLNASIKGMIAKFFGYPSEKAKEVMDKLITNTTTSKTFADGKMEQLELFDKDKK